VRQSAWREGYEEVAGVVGTPLDVFLLKVDHLIRHRLILGPLLPRLSGLGEENLADLGEAREPLRWRGDSSDIVVIDYYCARLEWTY
jgi:hypothetical protein